MINDTVLISVGSNIQPEKYIPAAVRLLEEQFGPVRVSNVYETKPVGGPGSNFLNLAVEIQTDMRLDALKFKVLRVLEAQLGRVRTSNKFDPRTIDLDVAVYHGKVIDPDIFSYAHLAVPIAELEPDLYDAEKRTPISKAAGRFIQSDEIQRKAGILIS